MSYVTTLLASKLAHSAGNASKSGYTQIIASTAEQYDGIEITFRTNSGGVRALVDIAVGGLGSEVVVIANIPIRTSSNSNIYRVFFPLRIAASSRVAIASQANGAGQTFVLSAWGVKGAFTSYATCTTYGADTTNTTGTVVDGGGSANTEGNWVELTSACAADHDQLIVSVLSPITNASASVSVMVDIGTGAALSETAILNDIFALNPNGAVGNNVPCKPMFPAATVASGTRIAARCQADSTDAQGRTAGVIVHAMSAPYSSSTATPQLVGSGPLVRV